MSEVIKLKRGLDIKLKGKAARELAESSPTATYAIKPPDFPGVFPKLIARAGDEVKVGSPLFLDKNNPDVKFFSPVGGKVLEINRGERRRILEMIVEPAANQEFEKFDTGHPSKLEAGQIRKLLLESGLWPTLRRRPYNIIAKPDETPKAIFISAFDTRPLGVDMDFIVKGQNEAFQLGIDALKKLTEAPVCLSMLANHEHGQVFTQAKGVERYYFSGPHPAGEVGIQIHKISPVNKGEAYWHIHPQDVIMLGRFFRDGKVDPSRIVALAGSEVKHPRYYKTHIGAEISNLIKANISSDNVRYISGCVLSGTKIRPSGYIGFYDHAVSVLPEGTEPELFGWATPGFDKFSMSRTFFSWLWPKREYAINTNTKGGRRAFVVTGEYEKVLPMNLYPQQLLKAILVEDIDKMEQLGIYEVAEEDFALMEFVCTSKQPVQRMVRQGIELMMKELG